MTGLTLLPGALAAALPSIRWPLDVESCPPLYFEPLNKMKTIREKFPQSTPLDSILSGLPESLESLLPSENEETRHFGLVSMALLFLGHGLTDEAHDIVTPLSWPEDTHFGYGPSVYSHVSPSARSYATYVHCMVHRREAFNRGEFGMVGFSNADYWSNAVLNSPGVDTLPHQDLWNEIGPLVRQSLSIPGVKVWYEWHDLLSKEKKPFFESRAVHALCLDALRRSEPDLQDFAERVAETELRILLGHALQNAGYDCDLSVVLRHDSDNAMPATIESHIQPPPMDKMAALSAARRVSSAHLNMFQTSGSVTIRSVWNADVSPASVAVGVACRLLESPACRPALSSEEGAVLILLPTTSEEATATESESIEVSLSPGDLHAVRLLGDEICSNGPWYTFAACDPTDARACFVDQLFGKRGETPTTVVQWSKDTIF